MMQWSVAWVFFLPRISWTRRCSSWGYQREQTEKKKKRHKSWLSLTIGPGMGKCSKTENLQSITSLLQPKSVGKKAVVLTASHNSPDRVERLDIHSHQPVKRCPTPVPKCCQRRPRRGWGLSPLPRGSEATTPSGVSGGHVACSRRCSCLAQAGSVEG